VKNTLRKALLGRELSPGTWLQIGHPASAEILARAGFDWVCVDLEHGGIDIETMTDIFRALDAGGCVPVARLPMNDPVWIHRALDAGAQGLVIPMVKTAEEAERAVREAKYPPRGVRGFGFCRANTYGVDFSVYAAGANDEIAMILQIEHIDAIENLDGILEVNGVDCLFIGPVDLSGSMGIVGQLDHPDMAAVLEKFRDACSRHGVAAGTYIVTPDELSIRTAIDEGYTLLGLGIDSGYLFEGAKKALENVKIS